MTCGTICYSVSKLALLNKFCTYLGSPYVRWSLKWMSVNESLYRKLMLDIRNGSKNFVALFLVLYTIKHKKYVLYFICVLFVAIDLSLQ
jgi:hypothetical protein